MNELLKGKKLEDQSEEVKANLTILLDKMNKFRKAFGRPMTVTSGLRDKADMIRIYKIKGVTDLSKIPMKSKHISGQACDIADPDLHVQKFILDNIPLIEELGLYFEDFHSTIGKSTEGAWVHFQIIPPGSGRRFFIP
jgi:hypothetical protein